MTVPAWDEDLSTQVRGKQADIRSLAAQAQKVVKQNQAQITLLQNQLKAVQRESEAEERYAATLHASGVDVQRASVERELDEMARLFEAESLKCAGVTSAIKPLQAQVLSARRAAMNGGKPPMVSAARAKKRHDISQAKLQRVLGACSEAEREAERLRLELSSLLREKRACEEKMSGLQAERLLHEASAAKDSEATTLAATSCSAARSHMRALEAQLERHTRWRSAQQLEMERKVRLAEVKRSKSGSRQREALSAALALSHIAKKGEEKDIAASMTISRSRLSAGKSALLADAKAQPTRRIWAQSQHPFRHGGRPQRCATTHSPPVQVADCIAALQEFHGADGTQDVGTLIARLLAADEASARARTPAA